MFGDGTYRRAVDGDREVRVDLQLAVGQLGNSLLDAGKAGLAHGLGQRRLATGQSHSLVDQLISDISHD